MKAEDIKPRLNYVVIERVEASSQTPGGITLPENVRKKENLTHRVVNVGPGTWNDAGDRIPIGLERGDYVVLIPNAVFFEFPGMPGVAITADDALVATVPKEVAERPVYETKIVA